MRTISETTAAVLTGSHEVSAYVSAFYDGRPILDELPLVEGDLEYDNTNEVPGSLAATLPRYYTDPLTGEVIDLLPNSANAPLATEGTQLTVSYVVYVPGRGSETINMGWYRIESWEETDSGTITVAAASLEAIVQDARLLSAKTIKKNTTYAAAFRSLLGGLLPYKILADQNVKTGKQVFEDDRLKALGELCDAWPGRMYVNDSGTLVVAPPFNDNTDTVDLTLADGADGTVVQAPRNGSREGVYNAVKASGEADGDTAPVAATVYLRDGSRRWNGPYGNVPYFYASPLLTTKSQCTKAATTRLRNLQKVANPVVITATPDPRIEPGDVISLATSERTLTVRVDGLKFPLTYAGSMELTCHELGTIAGLDEEE